MSLLKNLDRPESILEKGEMLGFEYRITNNFGGARCGYIKVPPGHPWHGMDFEIIPCEVHGGLTFSSGESEGSEWWIGFDFAHPSDLRDPDLPFESSIFRDEILGFYNRIQELCNRGSKPHLWTQDEIRAECMRVAGQAKGAVKDSLTVPD